jgi:hypothetical protein
MKNLSKNYYKAIKNETGFTINIDINNLPVLYQYFPVTEYSIKHFIENEIWGTVPSSFNDPYDSIACYEESNIKKYIEAKLTNEKIANYKAFFDDFNSKKNFINSILNETTNNFNKFRSFWCVACFSININSEIMWGHYSKNSTGFALSYDAKLLCNRAEIDSKITFNEIKKMNPFNIDYDLIKEDKLFNLFPVFYNSEKYNDEDSILKGIDSTIEFLDNRCSGMKEQECLKLLINNNIKKYYSELEKQNNVIYNILSRKNKCWEYEQEWRLISYNKNSIIGKHEVPYVKIGNLKPTALYLGEFISDYDKIALFNIAQQKHNIPVYQMKTKMTKNKCSLVTVRINDIKNIYKK